MLGLAVYAVGFIVASGLMALIEAAFLSVTRGEVEELVSQRRFGAAALQQVTERLTQALVVIVLCTKTTNTISGSSGGNQPATQVCLRAR